MSVVVRSDASWKCLGYPQSNPRASAHLRRQLNSMCVFVDGFDRTQLGTDWQYKTWGNGSVSINGSAVRVQGSGGFLGSSDAGAAIYLPLHSEWVAVEVDIRNPYELTGPVTFLMVRSTLSADSPYYAIALSGGTSDRLVASRREATGVSASTAAPGSLVVFGSPLRLRIERASESTLVAKVSMDGGLTWQLIDRREMPAMGYVCLCASDGKTVCYDDFSMEARASEGIEATSAGFRLRDGAPDGEHITPSISLRGLQAVGAPTLRYDVYSFHLYEEGSDSWGAGILQDVEPGPFGDLQLSTFKPAFRRIITLDVPTPYPDYQVRVRLTSANFDYSKVRSDGGDIRFVDVNGNPLSYWIESWNPGGVSDIWVRLPFQGTVEFYMTYGDPSAASQSSGRNTFPFFDDFDGESLDPSLWYVRDDASYAVDGGTLRIMGGAIGLQQPLPFSLADGYAVEVLVRYDGLVAGLYGGAAPQLLSSQFAKGTNNNGADAVVAVMRAMGGRDVRLWAAKGSKTGFDFYNAYLLWQSTDGVWERIRVGVGDGLLRVWRSDSQMASSGGATWQKELRFLALGALHEGLQSIQETSYDFIFVRRWASTEPVVTIGPEQQAPCASEGIRLSPVIDLSVVGDAQDIRVFWDATTPDGTAVSIESNLSLDAGQTWAGWQPCENGGSLPGFLSGMSLVDARLQLRQVLTTVDQRRTPLLHRLLLGVVTQESHEGVAIEASVSTDGGATWSGWQPLQDGAVIAGLPASGSLDQACIQLRIRMMSTPDGAPLLRNLRLDNVVGWTDYGYDDTNWSAANDNGGSAIALWKTWATGVPDADARWIWDRSSTSSAPAGYVYFRKSFSLQSPSVLKFAVGCDEMATVYVDGSELVRCSRGMNTATATFQPGEHVIAVEASNHTGPAGFLLTAQPLQVKDAMSFQGPMFTRINPSLLGFATRVRLVQLIKPPYVGFSRTLLWGYRLTPSYSASVSYRPPGIRLKRTITSQVIIYGLYMIGGREGTAETRGRHTPFAWEPFVHHRWHQTPKYREREDDDVVEPGEEPPTE